MKTETDGQTADSTHAAYRPPCALRLGSPPNCAGVEAPDCDTGSGAAADCATGFAASVMCYMSGNTADKCDTAGSGANEVP